MVSAGRGGMGAGGSSAGTAGAGGTAAMAGRGGDGGAAGSMSGTNGGQAGGGGEPMAGTAGGGAGSGGAASGGAGLGGEGGEAGASGAEDGGSGGEPSGNGGAGGASDPPRLDGDLCSTALTLGATVSGSTSEFTNDHNNASCFGYTLAGADVVYSLSIPPVSRTAIVADPADTFDVALYAIRPPAQNCTPVPVCAYGADLAITGGNETLIIHNYESEWRSYYLMVDGYGAATGNGTYDLSNTTATIPEGELCETALPLTIGEPIAATLDGFTGDYGGRPVCMTANAQGADAVYWVSVPAGNTLSLVAAPAANMDIALYIFDAATAAECRTASACLAAADMGFGSDPETLTYSNTGATRDVFIHVDRFDLGTQVGDYTLTATLTPNPLP